jgi:hypothetical protein
LCHKSVHGSTGSPRTDHSPLEISCLAIRPEPVEGQTGNYDTVSQGGRVSLPAPAYRQAGVGRGGGDVILFNAFVLVYKVFSYLTLQKNRIN